MRLIYIPTINLLIVFFNKSGSTIFENWIKNLVLFLEFPFESSSTAHVDYIDFIIKVYEKKPKIYFFVRNPLERMITSFYWVNTFDIRSKIDKYPLEEFVQFANNITLQIMESNDMHLLPQSWELVKINNYLNDRENSMFEFQNFRYDKRFFKGCELVIIQIEKFERNYEALMINAFTQTDNTNYKMLEDLSEHLYYKNSFGLISELHSNKTKFEKMFSILLYNFVGANIKKLPHHNNLYKGMLERLVKIKEGVESLNKINEIIANESKWLGYDNSLILNMNRFI